MRLFTSAFCITLAFALTSCLTSRNIPPGQISKVPNWKNLYFFHAGDSTWIVRPITEAGNQFSGIIYNPEQIKKSRQIHIYAEPLYAVKITNGKLTVPMENIIKVENYKINPIMILASVGIVAVLFLTPVFL